MSDVETLTDVPEQEVIKTAPIIDDFPSMGVDIIKKINFRVAIFMILVGVFALSDVFIEMLPSKYHEVGCANTGGTIAQLTLLCLSYIVIDLLVQGGVV